MKSFKFFIEKMDYHHSSPFDIEVDKHNAGKGKDPNDPIWLSHNKVQAKGWHKSIKSDRGKANTYKAKVKGKIAQHDDQKIMDLFDKNNLDMYDYHDDLVSNPSAREVHNHPATKMLKKSGYVGYVHPDYDAYDNQKDHDSTIIFHRKNVQMSLSNIE